ncbi:MAG TPA: hypothetical protein VG873_17965 [Burkholderiales bacterium]|nr:hypothetical protein [Burkholderiales bacterium]
MCGKTFDPEEGVVYKAFVPPSEELVARTRSIEASLPGARVPEEAWAAFFGAACVAIDWGHFERMFEARKAAAAYLAVLASARRRRPAADAFRCIAD